MFALRDIAHDLRQPLSTIEAIAYYLSLVLPHDDEKTHEQLDRLQLLVEQSNWILSNGLSLNDPPTPAAEQAATSVDLEEIIAQTLAARPAPSVELQLSGSLPRISADPAATRALIGNLITLFRQVATADHPAVVRTCPHPPGVAMEITTGAPGFRSIAGGSLSLECARRAAEAQHGTLEVSFDGRVRLKLVLP
jgi:light-regulated signal transduction histidine kinase (bacteriophytochrome)